MGAFKKTVIAVSVAGVFGFLGAMDYSEALIQDATEKDARPARVAAADRALPFTFPIDYKAAICTRTYYGERATCRYYVERTK